MFTLCACMAVVRRVVWLSQTSTQNLWPWTVKRMLHGKVSSEVPLPCGLATPMVTHWQSKFGLRQVPRHTRFLHAPRRKPPETSS